MTRSDHIKVYTNIPYNNKEEKCITEEMNHVRVSSPSLATTCFTTLLHEISDHVGHIT
jgi:hypothetical protein